jgi:hypothetical protein
MSADRGRPHTSTALWKARDIHDMLPNFQLACSFELDFSYHADLPLVQPLKLGDRRPTIPQLFAPPRKQSRRWSNHQHQKNQQTTLRNIQLANMPTNSGYCSRSCQKMVSKNKKAKTVKTAGLRKPGPLLWQERAGPSAPAEAGHPPHMMSVYITCHPHLLLLPLSFLLSTTQSRSLPNLRCRLCPLSFFFELYIF